MTPGRAACRPGGRSTRKTPARPLWGVGAASGRMCESRGVTREQPQAVTCQPREPAPGHTQLWLTGTKLVFDTG